MFFSIFIVSINYLNFVTYSEKLTSSICAILICTISYFSTINSLYSFMVYLFLDTFFRQSILTPIMICHHIIAFLLTFFGTLIIHLNNENRALMIANYFITMEITSPLLHLTKHYKNENKHYNTFVCAVLLIASWIWFRLFRPYQALTLIHSLLHNNPWLFLVYSIGLLLFLLQIYWFMLLCVLFHSFLVENC